MIDIDIYQQQATKVKKYLKGQELLYLLAKLTEETGEVAKEFIKQIDGKDISTDLKSELGDIIWTCIALAELNNITFSDILKENLKKLEERNLL